MQYDFDSIIERRHTFSMKWDFMNTIVPNTRPDTIPLWVADMDFRSPPPVIEALMKAVDHGIFGYSFAQGDDYTGSITGWFFRRFGWSIDPRHIVYSSGVVPSIQNLLLSQTEPGDGVIVQQPVYNPFERVIRSTGRTVVVNPLINTNGYYTIDYNDLENRARDPRTTAMILCSPHNPVGRVWSREELLRIIGICRDNGVLLISDEIHCDLVRRGQKHIPAAMLAPGGDIVTCTAPSKTFNMPGLHMSSVFFEKDERRRRYEDLVGREFPTPLSIPAAMSAYNEGEPWLEELLDYLDGNFRFLAEFAEQELPKARFVPSEGTYLAWLDVSGYGCDTVELKKRLARHAGVMPEAGDAFGIGGAGFFRINLGCPRQQLHTALCRMADFMSQDKG